LFACAIDDALSSQVLTSIEKARITLTERHLTDAVIKADEGDVGGAKADINGQISAWPQVGISFGMIQPKLWECCVGVTSGKLVSA